MRRIIHISYIAIILLGGWFLFNTLPCSGQAIHIISAEYFWNTDPGEGNGTSILALDGNLDEAVEAVFASAITAPPGAGPHTFNIRVKGNNNTWGPVFSSVLSSDAHAAIQITQAEYFWNADPGEGNGTAILALDGNLDDAMETVFASAIAAPPAAGTHTFNIRVKGSNNTWGPIFSSVLSSDAHTAIQIMQAEYFWDSDPGEGAGTVIMALDGNLDEAVEALLASGIAFPGTAEAHTFNIRVKDPDNSWGPVFKTVVSSASSNNNRIIQAEFFWNIDPGEGNGMALLALDGSFEEAVETVLDSGVSIPDSSGSYTFNVRVRNSSMSWGRVYSAAVSLPNLHALNIAQAEYFWDTDPGEGNGEVILALDGNFGEAVESLIKAGIALPDSSGSHTFNVRMKNLDDTWGPLFSAVVSSPDISAVKIMMAEYFWNNDPGEGNGQAMLAIDGMFDQALEGINNSIVVPDTTGPQILSVRMKNQYGQWGPLFSTVVNVPSGQSNYIAQAEYFLDTDPGEGNGFAFDATDGNFDEAVEALYESIRLGDPDCLPHTFHIRTKGFQGSWGPVFSSVVETGDSLPPVAQCRQVTVFLDETGYADLDSNLFDDHSTDNCYIEKFEMDRSYIDCGDGIRADIYMYMYDRAGNKDSCLGTIAIMDSFNRTYDVDMHLCEGDSAFLEGHWQTHEGLYVDDHSPSSNRCDSIVRTTLHVNPKQDVTIDGGWNIVSSYMIPEDPQIDKVFDGIHNEIIIVKDAAGSVYIPSIPLNLIGDWDYRQGYKVKATQFTRLLMGCEKIVPEDHDIHLPSGWSIISYLRDNPEHAETALASLRELIIAKDNAGNIYIPAIPLNTIGNLVPGQGYQVKLANPDVLTYPSNARHGSFTQYTDPGSTSHYSLAINTGSNATVVIPEGVVDGLTPGDEIAVFNRDGDLTASALYQGRHTVLPVWGKDALDENVPGMLHGEPYRFKVWRASTGEEYDLYLEFEQGAAVYSTNALSIAGNGQIKVGPDDAPIETNIFLYPNPASDVLMMEFWLPDATDLELHLYDVYGRKAMRSMKFSFPKGTSIIDLDITELPAGNYFYRIEQKGGSFNGQLVKFN